MKGEVEGKALAAVELAGAPRARLARDTVGA